MDFSANWLVSSFLVGTVGMGIFIYGKKQTRIPQLIAGIVLMGISWVVASPAWMVACAALVIGGLWAGTRAGL